MATSYTTKLSSDEMFEELRNNPGFAYEVSQTWSLVKNLLKKRKEFNGVNLKKSPSHNGRRSMRQSQKTRRTDAYSTRSSPTVTGRQSTILKSGSMALSLRMPRFNK